MSSCHFLTHAEQGTLLESPYSIQFIVHHETCSDGCPHSKQVMQVYSKAPGRCECCTLRRARRGEPGLQGLSRCLSSAWLTYPPMAAPAVSFLSSIAVLLVQSLHCLPT